VSKKYGKPPAVNKEIKEASRLSNEEWNRYFFGHWNFPGERQNGHLAMFPEELPRRLIKMFSFIGDTILDPFLGSGTTSLAAMRLGRHSIGYEINEGYLDFIREKLGVKENALFTDDQVEIQRQEHTEVDFEDRIKKLPYIFHDPVKFERKVDPKLLNFGSVIDGQETRRRKLFRVAKVISLEEVVLDSGLRVRLLGLRTNPEKYEKALEYMRETLEGKEVFLRLDVCKYDEEGNLLAYLYLKNRTFINLHMIKLGLVFADEEGDYAMRSKFLELMRGQKCLKSGF